MQLIAQLPVDHLPDPIITVLVLFNDQFTTFTDYLIHCLIINLLFSCIFQYLEFYIIFSYSIILGRYFWFKMSSLLPYTCRFICHSFGLSSEVLILLFLFQFSCSLGCVSCVSLHSSVRYSDILALFVALMYFYALTSPLLAFLSTYICNQILSQCRLANIPFPWLH